MYRDHYVLISRTNVILGSSLGEVDHGAMRSGIQIQGQAFVRAAPWLYYTPGL